jgi:diguanylate cyclase (GGDEF)-like protein
LHDVIIIKITKMIGFSELILKLGRIRSVTLVTLVSIALSVAFTAIAVSLFFDVSTENLQIHLKVAVLVALTIAPILTYGLIQLLFKISELEKETRNLATYDALTGLLSRRVFYELTAHQLKVACREKSSIALMMLDVDEFKKINDSHGHFAGDQALKLLGKIIVDTVRVSDIAGRIGGDEFIFCLPNTDADGAKVLGNRLIAKANSAKFNFNGKEIKIGLSVGVHAVVLEHGYEMSDLFHQADLALYEAKRQGKNQVR